MAYLNGLWAGASVLNLLAGFALGIVFGGKVRGLLAALLQRAADFVK